MISIFNENLNNVFNKINIDYLSIILKDKSFNENNLL